MSWRDEPRRRYRVMHNGQWRPVMNMFDQRGVPTTLPGRATAVVLYISKDEWLPTPVNQAEVFEDPAYETTEWELLTTSRDLY